MASGRLLVVDDERSMRELLGITLQQEGYTVTLAEGGEEAIARLRADTFDLVITDLRMRKVDGLEVVRACRELAPRTLVIMVTAYASTESAVQAIKLGAYDYLSKPFSLDEMAVTIAKALERQRLEDENLALRRRLRGREGGLAKLIGKSPALLELIALIRKTAESNSTVMITGESGTGKELVARAIHDESARRDGPFVSVNCAALTEGVLESELFGHVKGSFTGAIASTLGLFPAADGGTIFLDEIMEISPAVQVKLLRALQQREVRRVGDTRDTKIDVRVIAASNRDSQQAVARGLLRDDLFYRLNVIPIHVPALRHRREDIPLLVSHFISRVAAEVGKPVLGITPAALARLEQHRWPGNVRELENAVERAIVLGSGERVDVEALPPGLGRGPAQADTAGELPEAGFDLEAELERVEARYMEAALERAGGIQIRAAALLGLSFRQFRYKLQKHRQGLTARPPLARDAHAADRWIPGV